MPEEKPIIKVITEYETADQNVDQALYDVIHEQGDTIRRQNVLLKSKEEQEKSTQELLFLQNTKQFIEKAKKSLEKPKDLPRYQAVAEYEYEFKNDYVKGLTAALKAAITDYKVHTKDAIKSNTDTRTAANN